MADKFFTNNKVCGILIFSLCGKSQYPPKPDTQSDYLKPYFKHIKTSGNPYGVREIYFIEEKDFESLGWVALDQSFKDKAVVLKV